MKWCRLLSPCFVVVFLGCGTTQTYHVMTGYPGPPHGGDVAVFLLGQPGPPGLVEVGIVQAVGTGMEADLAHVVAGLKSEAAKLGCVAIVNMKIDQGSSTASGTGTCLRPP